MKNALTVFLLLGLAACAGKVDYIRPVPKAGLASNSKVIDRPRDAVWNSGVPELGKQFFVINNLDKSSGLINVSYSGDPEKYIDCGWVTSYVKNAKGERTHSFPGARAQVQYEVMDQNGLFFINRKMTLEGRVNLVFEEVSPTQTRVTANTRYAVTRQSAITAAANNVTRPVSDTISFNSNSSGSFAPNTQGQATECLATGALEQELLSAIK